MGRPGDLMAVEIDRILDLLGLEMHRKNTSAYSWFVWLSTKPFLLMTLISYDKNSTEILF